MAISQMKNPRLMENNQARSDTVLGKQLHSGSTHCDNKLTLFLMTLKCLP